MHFALQICRIHKPNLNKLLIHVYICLLIYLAALWILLYDIIEKIEKNNIL